MVAGAAAVAYFLYRGKSRKKAAIEWGEAKKKEETLARSMRDVKEKYAARKLTIQDATKMLLENESALEVQKKKITALEKRMGAKKPKK